MGKPIAKEKSRNEEFETECYYVKKDVFKRC